jgi:hypothetical protein
MTKTRIHIDEAALHAGDALLDASELADAAQHLLDDDDEGGER